MRYVSPEGRLTGPDAAFDAVMSPREMFMERVRETMGGGRFWSIALPVGTILAPVAAAVGAWSQIHAAHPKDVIGPQLITVWWERIGDGAAASDPSFYLFLICLLS